MSFLSWRTWVATDVLTAAQLNQDIRDNGEALFPDEDASVAWTPTLEATTADATVSAVAGGQYRVGAVQFVWARWVLSDPGSGDYFVTLPVACVGLTASTSSGLGTRIGGYHARDITPPWMLAGSVLLRSSTTAHFHGSSLEVPAGESGSGVLRSDGPRVWASGDVISFHAQYPIA